MSDWTKDGDLLLQFCDGDLDMACLLENLLFLANQHNHKMRARGLKEELLKEVDDYLGEEE